MVEVFFYIEESYLWELFLISKKVIFDIRESYDNLLDTVLLYRFIISKYYILLFHREIKSWVARYRFESQVRGFEVLGVLSGVSSGVPGTRMLLKLTIVP